MTNFHTTGTRSESRQEEARFHLQVQVCSMAAVTYGPMVVACHAKCGYLAVPLVFGDFPAVVGSPYFLGVVPAVQATPKAAPTATATRGTKPYSSQGRVFSVNTISCVAVPRKRGQRQGRRGSKPRAVVSNSGKTVLVGDIRVRLDGGEPILPRDRSVPTVATSNKYAPLQGMRQEDRDSPKGARQGQASSSAPQPPRKIRQMWVTKQEARQIKQARADQPAERPKKATPGREKAQDPKFPRPRGQKRRGVYRKPNFVSTQAEPAEGETASPAGASAPRVLVFERLSASVFTKLGAAIRPSTQKPKKRRVQQTSEEGGGMKIFTCYASGREAARPSGIPAGALRINESRQDDETYADDTILFLADDVQQLIDARLMLEMVQDMTRLRANYIKSQVVEINMEEAAIARAAHVFRCHIGSLPPSYLGLPLPPDGIHCRDRPHAGMFDSWVWRWERGDKFSVRSTYQVLSDGGLCYPWFSQVWTPKSPLKGHHPAGVERRRARAPGKEDDGQEPSFFSNLSLLRPVKKTCLRTIQRSIMRNGTVFCVFGQDP
ncbi:hypothetical protein Taro_031859 [Colocasia esculenta]|uniref:Uncharacterized protein n=1 Tax=Colocasia esculenta TaxID=4460 RepID=A0A843W059_COLES|nr:hypothetical protein [Colocasia esculenta]